MLLVDFSVTQIKMNIRIMAVVSGTLIGAAAGATLGAKTGSRLENSLTDEEQEAVEKVSLADASALSGKERALLELEDTGLPTDDTYNELDI